METHKLISILIIGLLFASCTNTNTQINVPEKRISQIYVQSSNGFECKYTLEYDEKGRISKMESDNKGNIETILCEYNKKSFRIGEIFCKQNKQGYIHSSEVLEYAEAFAGKMEYDKNGRLVSIDNPYAGEISFKWIDDDMVLMGMGTMRTDVVYTSLENKNNLGLLMTLGHTSLFPYYLLLGKPTKHLPESMAEGLITFQYKMDADGYVEEILESQPHDNSMMHYRFSYE